MLLALAALSVGHRNVDRCDRRKTERLEDVFVDDLLSCVGSKCQCGDGLGSPAFHRALLRRASILDGCIRMGHHL
jgi:hypothetical protein